MQETIEAFVRSDGVVECIYTESVDLKEVGRLVVERASDVVWKEDKQWWEIKWRDTSLYDWRVVQSMFILHGFDSRAEAIQVEIERINTVLESLHVQV